MAFTYANVSTNVLLLAGHASGEANSDVLSRIYYWTDEAVREFQRCHRNYYYQDVSYRRVTDSSQPTGTITTTAGTYSVTFTYTGDWQDLVGATVVKTESGTEYRNIVREVTNTTSKTAELLLPSRFTTGTATLYIRSSKLSSASRVSPVLRFLEYGSFFTDESDCNYSLRKLEPKEFFSDPDLTNPVDTYPSRFTVVNDVPIFNTHWPLDSGYSVTFHIEDTPAVFSASSDSVAVPDAYQRAVEAYVLGMYLSRDLTMVQDGQMEILRAKRMFAERRI